jgi:LmeA-like phospholipid-binding
MEFLTLFLSGLLGILSPVGFVSDRLAASAIRSQFDSVEHLSVRIDNTPSYRLAQGRADRVRIAGRGLSPVEGVRIAAVEVETDAIAVDPATLAHPRLEAPLQAGVKLVLNRQDINRALQSEAVARQLSNVNLNFLSSSGDRSERSELVNPQIDFLANHRFRLQVKLRGQQTGHQDQITVESGVKVVSGRQFELVEPIIRLNDQAVPPQLVAILTGGISQYFDLKSLEASGITARVLKLETDGDQVTVAGFIRLDPAVSVSGK